MTPGTSWTEQSSAQQGWQTGLVPPGSSGQTLLLGGYLIGGHGLVGAVPTTYTEGSLASATTYTEGSLSASTSWTERSL